MNVYYWNAKPNFGDLLTSLLIKKFTGLDSQRTEIQDADLVMVGSIMEHIPNDWYGVIAGVGKLQERTKVTFPNATILAVRGYLSAKGLKGDFVIGDPGLLADELVSETDKEYDLGVVPHWTDKELAKRWLFQQYKPKIINVADDPIKVITEISKCKKIVSSSLHGIILADAFGIPRRVEIAPRMMTFPHQEGGLFKWRDYSSSIELPFQVGVTQQADRNKIIEKQHELFDVFEEIKELFG